MEISWNFVSPEKWEPWVIGLEFFEEKESGNPVCM